MCFLAYRLEVWMHPEGFSIKPFKVVHDEWRTVILRLHDRYGFILGSSPVTKVGKRALVDNLEGLVQASQYLVHDLGVVMVTEFCIQALVVKGVEDVDV